ncbi:Cobalt-zinc-cadmium resistance protein CzcA/Cation efflux system protein CusA [Mucinivorans hirudinis]|uniref:Cobalt-zinc-cadmium resistance protein CzcA/Cation efflux system protein CusA n=1 Tax=Mucinivorans hirudinis TaxID=1433126 RepID=A0A060R5T2_9BACT|nr:Cobalt-zinc-cadmium resistance protein CzcA/Cation efflux system protein CusA [Mucinivorans hirudinis]
MHKFIENIIGFSLRNHIFILFLTAVMLAIGIVCYNNTPVEAYPDVTNTRARIIAQWPGRSAEEMEKFVTLPIMQQFSTIPRKTDVRSVSLFGLSAVTVLFEDGVDDFFAQQYAHNSAMGLNLPDGVEFSVEPPSGATGEIFRYVIRGDMPISEISAINDWVVQRELLAVAGVASVTTFGGEEKTYEIRVDATKLAAYDVTPLDVYQAVGQSNINVGGDVIQKGSQAYVVRGLGLLGSVSDIENIFITSKGNSPIRVGDVADVLLSAKPRMGQVGFNDEDDVVQGVVRMLRGENPSEVIARIKEKIAELNERILPRGVSIEIFMDRTKLVDATLNTVLKNMIEGILLVALIVFLFLFNWRTTLIVASVIPLSFLFAVIMLRIQGLPANLISMGALDFGLLLEGTLVITEVVFVALLQKSQQMGDRFDKYSKVGVIKKGASSVASHIFFAQIILVVALFPIFSFQKVEGKMFSPLAFTLAYALLGSLLLALTYVPVMCKILLVKQIKEKRNKFTSALTGSIIWMYKLSSRYRKTTIALSLLLFVTCVVRFLFWGTEFVPNMNEGAIYIRATLPNSVNLDEAVRVTKQMKESLQKFDEVDFILTQTGRPNDGTDPTGFFNIELHVELKPEKEWVQKQSKEVLISRMQSTLAQYPGVVIAFSQPIQDEVEEYVAGVKSASVIKIFGSDLHALEATAHKTAEAIRGVRGIEDVNVFSSIGLPELQIKPQEAKMAQYSVTVADVQAVIEMAIGGKAATTFYENERTFDVMLRYQRRFRDNEQAIGNILIPTMDGKEVPLKEIADIEFVTGTAFIYREGNSRYVGIGFSVRNRDLGSTIEEAQKLVGENITLDPGTKMEWAGEFESQQRATRRLAVIVPAVLCLIIMLLYMSFGTVKDTLIAAGTMPYAFIGGFISLWATDTIFGISAGIGFIILFGIVSIDSILLIANMKRILRQTRDLDAAISGGVYQRVRPVLMIALMGAMGLLPAALSTGMGSEVQKPLAVMIVGGIIICMLLSFTITPQLFYYAYRRKKI